MTHCCFKKNCKSEAQYECLCLGCETFCCEFHLRFHLSLPYITHSFDSILEEPHEWTKYSILRFLENEKLKKEKLKKILNPSHSKFCESRLDTDLELIKSLIEKVSQFSEHLSNPLKIEQDSDKIMLPEDSETYKSVELFCKLNELRLKTNQILNKDKNDEETEEEFRKTCSFYQNYAFDPLVNKAFQEYKNAYKKISSLYLIYNLNNKPNWFIYDTESGKEERKSFETPVKNRVDYRSIIPLPNGQLFYIWEKYDLFYSIIDRDYKCRWHNKDKAYFCSPVYFKKSIYCFEEGNTYEDSMRSSRRFDLDEGRWIKLAETPEDSKIDSSIIFNNNILLSDSYNQIVYLYSIEIDSFSEISLGEFHKKWILINSNERAYLIGLEDASIFESEIKNPYSWKEIGISIINITGSIQAYFSYNKGEIYIAFANFYEKCRQYFKFDLSQKKLIEIACYHQHVGARKLEGKTEALKFDGQTFKLHPDYAADFTNNRCSLYYLSDNLEKTESLNQNIEINPINPFYYMEKGKYLRKLGLYLDAIECLNKAIEIDPNHNSYWQKGNAFHEMGRNLEAIQCYDQALSFENSIPIYINKGLALHNLNRYQEAIECYDKAIKFIYSDNQNESCRTLNPKCTNYVNCLKGEALYALGQYAEAINCYNKDYERGNVYFWSCISKGKALCELDRKLEAIDCYSELLEDNPNNFFFYCCRANVLNDVGREEEAMQDFNKAYYLMKIKRICFYENEFPYWDYNFIDENVVEYFFQLMKVICELEENAVKFKEKIQKLKDAKNLVFLKEIEENEVLVKEMRSKILKKAVECLDSSKNVSIEAILQVEKEVVDHIKATINVCDHLCSLVSTQQ